MWMHFTEWVDRALLPIWSVLLAMTFYFLWAFWRDMRILREQRELDEFRDMD